MITEFSVNENQFKFGSNQDKTEFWFTDQNLKCGPLEMKTAFIKIQNGKIISTFCKDGGDEKNHLKYNQDMQNAVTPVNPEVKRLLSLNYVRYVHYGQVYYVKNYGKIGIYGIRFHCIDDGTSLPVPRSGMIYNEPASAIFAEDFIIICLSLIRY